MLRIRAGKGLAPGDAVREKPLRWGPSETRSDHRGKLIRWCHQDLLVLRSRRVSKTQGAGFGEWMLCQSKGPVKRFVLLSPRGGAIVKLVGVPQNVFSEEKSDGTQTPC